VFLSILRHHKHSFLNVCHFRFTFSLLYHEVTSHIDIHMCMDTHARTFSDDKKDTEISNLVRLE